MLSQIHPKLPMRNKSVTGEYYITQLGFEIFGGDFAGYLMIQKDNVQIHFFEFKDLDPKTNYGQVYIRVSDIDRLYQSFVEKKIPIHPNGALESKPWGQREFSLLDPDNNLLTFGESINVTIAK
ncbi:MAG: VOC family protein [Bacteroidetes bacterium]|nr:VOC family protein [Bacteroidota bacterium]